MSLSALRVAVIVFPGSNCDRDMMVAIEKLAGRRTGACLAQGKQPGPGRSDHYSRRVFLWGLSSLWRACGAVPDHGTGP